MQKYYQKKYIELFIILQPLIDMVTGVMATYFNPIISVGIFLRSLFLVYALIYLIFICKEKRKWNCLYLVIILLFHVSRSVVVYFSTEQLNLFSELTQAVKIFYLPLILLFLYRLMEEKGQLDILIFVKSSFFICLSMLVAQITHTSFCSYGSNIHCDLRRGISGWFYSANEISAILAILFPICIFYFFKEKKNVLAFLTLILSLYGLFVIGTKMAFLVGLFTLFFTVIMHPVIRLVQKQGFKDLSRYLTIVVLFIISLLMIPTMPAYKNLKGNINKNEILAEGKENANQIIFDNTVFSGRSEKQRLVNSIYQNAPLLQSLFGIGREKDGVNMIIERDFHDIYYYYGKIGFIIIISILFVMLSKIFLLAIANFKKMFQDDLVLLSLSVIFALVSAYISGHTLVAPAVTIYLACVIPILYERIKKVSEPL